MRLREKLIHYTNDLDDVDLKQEAIATIEHIAQCMDEDELLHHSRPLALAYLALTEDASVSDVHGRWEQDADGDWYCTNCGEVVAICDSGRERTYRKPYCPNCGAKMDGGDSDEAD